MSRIIMIDPGHGSTKGSKGFDSGATFGFRTEAEANLEAALTLKFLLSQLGWTVYLTHDGRQGAKPDLVQRLKRAVAVDADIFLSIHFDQVFTPPRHESGIYYAPGVSSLMLAKALLSKMPNKNAWLRSSSLSRFGGLYIDAFPDARPSVMLELDSIQYAPGSLDGASRTRMLSPIANTLNTFLKQ